MLGSQAMIQFCLLHPGYLATRAPRPFSPCHLLPYHHALRRTTLNLRRKISKLRLASPNLSALFGMPSPHKSPPITQIVTRSSGKLQVALTTHYLTSHPGRDLFHAQSLATVGTTRQRRHRSIRRWFVRSGKSLGWNNSGRSSSRLSMPRLAARMHSFCFLRAAAKVFAFSSLQCVNGASEDLLWLCHPCSL